MMRFIFKTRVQIKIAEHYAEIMPLSKAKRASLISCATYDDAIDQAYADGVKAADVALVVAMHEVEKAVERVSLS